MMNPQRIALLARAAVCWPDDDRAARLRNMFPDAEPAERSHAVNIAFLAVAVGAILDGTVRERITPVVRASARERFAAAVDRAITVLSSALRGMLIVRRLLTWPRSVREAA
jgi:hypothetical protein